MNKCICCGNDYEKPVMAKVGSSLEQLLYKKPVPKGTWAIIMTCGNASCMAQVQTGEWELVIRPKK